MRNKIPKKLFEGGKSTMLRGCLIFIGTCSVLFLISLAATVMITNNHRKLPFREDEDVYYVQRCLLQNDTSLGLRQHCREVLGKQSPQVVEDQIFYRKNDDGSYAILVVGRFKSKRSFTMCHRGCGSFYNIQIFENPVNRAGSPIKIGAPQP